MARHQDTQPGIGAPEQEPTLFSVAVQVARIEERLALRDGGAEDRQDALRALIRDSVRDALAPVNTRLDAIEKKAERLTYLSAGASAVVASGWWLYQHFGKLVGLLVIVAYLQGCATEQVVDSRLSARWCVEERPAHVVVSDAVSVECQDAVAAAVDFWADNGVDYLTFAVVPDADITSTPLPLFIQVVNELPADPGASGDTQRHRVTASCIDAAQVRLHPDYCHGNTAAHELGHALGLEHVEVPSNLMWRKNTPGGYVLTPTQLEHVR